MRGARTEISFDPTQRRWKIVRVQKRPNSRDTAHRMAGQLVQGQQFQGTLAEAVKRTNKPTHHSIRKM